MCVYVFLRRFSLIGCFELSISKSPWCAALDTALLAFLCVQNPKDILDCLTMITTLAFLGVPKPLSGLYKDTEEHRLENHSSAFTWCLHLCHRKPLDHKRLMQSEKVHINLSFMSWFNAKHILLALLTNFMTYPPPDGSSSPDVPIVMIPPSVMNDDNTQSSSRNADEKKAHYGRATD